jgi:putative cell wall-binding protein
LAVLTLAAVMALGGLAGGAVTFTAEKLGGGGLVAARDPETSGSLVVWTSTLLSSPDPVIRVHDLMADTTVSIGTGTDNVDQVHADVSAGRIVYEYDDGADVDIRMWDSRINTHMPIAETSADELGPRIDGNLVVWYVPSAGELRYRDLGRGITSAVVPGSRDVEHWDVDNGAIVWSFEYSASSDRIWRFRPGIDTEAHAVYNLFDNLDITSVQVHGTSLAWTEERTDGGDTDAWWGDISSDYGIVRSMVEPGENLFTEQNPVAFHRDIAWETNKMGSFDLLYRTMSPLGDVSAAAGGASDTVNQGDASMFGRRIVYEDRATVGTEVWLSSAAPEVARTAGDDRYLTAIETSKAYFRRANNAVLCTGLNFPDALSAAPLARLVSGPLLLTRPAAVDDATIAELNRLAVEKVYVIGGPDVISNDVMTQITNETGAACTRIYGSDRYQTSAAIAERMGTLLSGPHTIRRAFFARGDNFPDALALGPVAASTFSPILLVRTNEVPTSIAITVDDLDITSGVIAGGTDVVSNGVRDSLRTLMIANGGDDHDPQIIERWAGNTRYETAIAIVEGGIAGRWIDLDTLGFATGLNFPDALGGGAALGCYGSGVLLTTPGALPTSVTTFLDDHEYQIGRADFFGGTDVISEAVKTAVAAKLQ